MSVIQSVSSVICQLFMLFMLYSKVSLFKKIIFYFYKSIATLSERMYKEGFLEISINVTLVKRCYYSNNFTCV